MTLKEGFQTVGKIVVSSLISAGILLMIYSFTKRDNAGIILQKDVDSKATKVELINVKSDLSKKIEIGDTAMKNEFTTYTTEHAATHEAEMGQLKIVVDWVRSQPND